MGSCSVGSVGYDCMASLGEGGGNPGCVRTRGRGDSESREGRARHVLVELPVSVVGVGVPEHGTAGVEVRDNELA